MSGILSPLVDLRSLTRCCITTVQHRAELPAEGDTATCPCGHALVVVDGRWRAHA